MLASATFTRTVSWVVSWQGSGDGGVLQSADEGPLQILIRDGYGRD